MNPAPLCCILIPVHNRRDLTLACLRGLDWCANDATYKVIVIDDGSTDGTSAAIADHHPHVQIVHGNGNLFWTGAIRLGMETATAHNATEHLWLNDDTLPTQATLRRLIDQVRQNPQRIVGASPTVDGVPTAFSSLGGVGVTAAPGERKPVDVLAGFMVALSSRVVDRIGFPDSHRFPHYAGDSSYTRTAHNHGFELWIDGDAPLPLARFEPYPSLADAFWNPSGKSLPQRFQSTFLAKRSKFRLPTQWHLDRLYRGSALGSLAFVARCMVWTWQIATAGRHTTPTETITIAHHA